jgi:hypothetical protein
MNDRKPDFSQAAFRTVRHDGCARRNAALRGELKGAVDFRDLAMTLEKTIEPI